jgi:hypothetical protein
MSWNRLCAVVPFVAGIHSFLRALSRKGVDGRASLEEPDRDAE